MGALLAGAWSKLAPGKGWSRLELGPGGRPAAVSATARAGCGRGRDGRGCGEWKKLHGSATDLSPKCLLVTEMSGSPVFLPSFPRLQGGREGAVDLSYL